MPSRLRDVLQIPPVFRALCAPKKYGAGGGFRVVGRGAFGLFSTPVPGLYELPENGRLRL